MNEGQNGGFNGQTVDFDAQKNVGAQPTGVQPTAAPVQTMPVQTMPPQSAPTMPTQPMTSATQQPIMSSSNDVVIGGGAPEKKSHGGMIALIALAILVLAGGAGLILWQSGVFGGGNSVTPVQQPDPYQPSADLAVDLRKTINYMYSGERSDAVLADIPNDVEFKFEKEFYSDNVATRSEYFKTAMTLHNNAMDTLLDNKSDAESVLNTTLTDIGYSLGRVSAVAKIEAVSMGSLAEDYAQYNSVPRLKKIVEERYGGLLESDIDGLEFYGQAYIDFLDMKVDEIALIVQNDCLSYVSDWESFEGLSSCPNLENFVEKVKTIEAKKGKLGFTPSNEKGMADDMIESDIRNLTESYRRLNTELNR